MPDIETTGRKMKKKLDEFSDKVEKAQESWKQRQAERREDEKWNKRKGKDPWEW